MALEGRAVNPNWNPNQPRDNIGRWTAGGTQVAQVGPGIGHNGPPAAPVSNPQNPAKITPSTPNAKPMRGMGLPAVLDFVFNTNRLPVARQDAINDTLSHLNQGTTPTDGRAAKWGAKFKNEEGHLPNYGEGGILDNLKNGPITYKEYYVNKLDHESGSGVYRIVVGSDGSRYL